MLKGAPTSSIIEKVDLTFFNEKKAMLTRFQSLLAGAFVLLSALGTSRLGALVPLSFDELAKDSKYIVTGRVVKMRSYVAPFHDLGNWVFTDVTVRVESALKGGQSKSDRSAQHDTNKNNPIQDGEITFQVVGGTLDGFRCICPDSASYSINARVLVFLRPVASALWNTGWRQGKYRITSDGEHVLGKRRLPIGRKTRVKTIRNQGRRFSDEPKTFEETKR